MLETINNLLGAIDDFVWGVPLIVLILATGIYMTLHHCVPMTANTFVDISAFCVAVVLITAAFLYKRLRRKKLSPIALIVLSAILGILLY